MSPVGTKMRVAPMGSRTSTRVTISNDRHSTAGLSEKMNDGVFGQTEARVAPPPLVRNLRRSIEVLLAGKQLHPSRGSAGPDQKPAIVVLQSLAQRSSRRI